MYKVSDKVAVRVDLDGKLANELEAVKRARGLTQTTEVIRSLIHETYRVLHPAVDEVEELQGAAAK